MTEKHDEEIIPFHQGTANIADKAREAARRYTVRISPEGDRSRAECQEFPGMMITAATPAECWNKAYDAIALMIATMLEDGAIPPAPVALEGAETLERQVNFRVSDRDRDVIAAASREGGFRSVSDFARYAAIRTAKQELRQFGFKWPTDE